MKHHHNKHHQNHLHVDVEKAATEVVKFRDSAFKRFPIVFTLLSSFGLVSTFYGFEKIIDQIPVFVNHPWLILAMGLTTLVGTGALYKKLK